MGRLSTGGDFQAPFSVVFSGACSRQTELSTSQTIGGPRRPRPASAGFVGAFRAAIKPNQQRAKLGASAASRPHSAPNIRISPAEPWANAREQENSVLRSRPQRPLSAADAGSEAYQEYKRRSEWASFAKQECKMEKQIELDRAVRQREVAGEKQREMKGVLAERVKMRNNARRKRECERRVVDEIVKEDNRDKIREQQKADEKRMQVKALLQSQVVESRKRREIERRRQLEEEELAKRECARLIAEEAAKTASEKEAKRQLMVRNTMELQEQTRLKQIVARQQHEADQKRIKEYDQLLDKQEAARNAKFREAAERLEGRMVSDDVIKSAKDELLAAARAKEEALRLRNEQHMQARYVAEEAKFARESCERKVRVEECEAQRRQQMEWKREQEQKQFEEEREIVMKVVAHQKDAAAKEREQAVARQAKAMAHQRELLLQIDEGRGRWPVEMSQTEKEFNRSALQGLGACDDRNRDAS